MICAECEREKPDCQFLSHRGVARKICEACAERHRIKGQKRRQREKQNTNVPLGFKKCHTCFKIKDLEEFKVININNGNKYGINCAKCAESVRKAQNKWRAKNPEKAKQLHDKYVEENKEKLKAYDRSRRHLRIISTTAWTKDNKTKVNAYNARRRAERNLATPKWLTPTQLAEIEGVYLFCQIFPGFHVDHIIPLKGKNVCGLHVPWNLQPLAAVENMRKGNRVKDI